MSLESHLYHNYKIIIADGQFSLLQSWTIEEVKNVMDSYSPYGGDTRAR